MAKAAPRLTTGQYMRLARLEAKLSIRMLSNLSGVPQNVILGYEKDDHTPSLQNLVRLVDVLGLTIDEYVGHQVRDPKYTEAHQLNDLRLKKEWERLREEDNT